MRLANHLFSATLAASPSDPRPHPLMQNKKCHADCGGAQSKSNGVLNRTGMKPCQRTCGRQTENLPCDGFGYGAEFGFQ